MKPGEVWYNKKKIFSIYRGRAWFLMFTFSRTRWTLELGPYSITYDKEGVTW